MVVCSLSFFLFPLRLLQCKLSVNPQPIMISFPASPHYVLVRKKSRAINVSMVMKAMSLVSRQNLSFNDLQHHSSASQKIQSCCRICWTVLIVWLCKTRGSWLLVGWMLWKTLTLNLSHCAQRLTVPWVFLSIRGAAPSLPWLPPAWLFSTDTSRRLRMTFAIKSLQEIRCSDITANTLACLKRLNPHIQWYTNILFTNTSSLGP